MRGSTYSREAAVDSSRGKDDVHLRYHPEDVSFVGNEIYGAHIGESTASLGCISFLDVAPTIFNSLLQRLRTSLD